MICKPVFAVANSFTKIIDQISQTIGTFTAWLVLPLVFATVYEVLSRYFFNAPTILSRASSLNKILGSFLEKSATL